MMNMDREVVYVLPFSPFSQYPYRDSHEELKLMEQVYNKISMSGLTVEEVLFIYRSPTLDRQKLSALGSALRVIKDDNERSAQKLGIGPKELESLENRGVISRIETNATIVDATSPTICGPVHMIGLIKDDGTYEFSPSGSWGGFYDDVAEPVRRYVSGEGLIKHLKQGKRRGDNLIVIDPDYRERVVEVLDELNHEAKLLDERVLFYKIF